MEKYVGSWEVSKIPENLDDMFKAMDMDEAKRKMFKDMKYTLTFLHHEGDEWESIVSLPNGFKKCHKYKIGEPFDAETIDGKPITSTVTIEDGKFVEVHVGKADPSIANMTREIVGEDMVLSTTFKGITCVSTLERV